MKSIKTTNIMIITVLVVVIVGFVINQFFTKLVYDNGFQKIEMKKKLSFLPKKGVTGSEKPEKQEIELDTI